MGAAQTQPMTVAARIEIVTAGRPEPGQSQILTKAQGRTQSAAWAGAPVLSQSSSAAPGTESFQSQWRSLLATLGADGNGLIQEEAGADGIQNSAEPALAETPRKATPAAPTLSSAAALLPSPGGVPQGGPAAIATKLPVVGYRVAIPAWTTASKAPRQAAADLAAKPPMAVVRPAESANRPHAVTSAKGAKQETVSSGSKRALVSATAGSVPQAMAAPGAGSPVENAADLTPRLPLANLSEAFPSVSIPDSFNPHAPHPDEPSRASGTATAEGNQGQDAVTGTKGTPPSQPGNSNEPAERTDDSGDHATDIVIVPSAANSSRPGYPNASAEKAADAGSLAGITVTGTSVPPSSRPGYPNASAEKAADAGSLAGITVTGTSVRPSSRPGYPNASAEKAADAGSLAGITVTGTSVRPSSRPGYPNASAEKAADAGSLAGITVTGTSVPPSSPAGSSKAPVERAIEAGNLAVDQAEISTAHSFDPGHRGSIPGPTVTSARRAASGAGDPAPAAKTWPNPPTSPLVPVQTGAAVEPLDPKDSTPSSGTESWTAGEAAPPSGRMRPQVEESLELLTRPPHQIQPQPGSQGLEAAATANAGDWMDRPSAPANAAASQPTQLSAIPPLVRKIGLGTGGGAPAGLHTASGPGMVDPVAHGREQLEGQLAGRAADSYAVARDLAGATAATNTVGGAAGGSASALARPAAGETFAALDAETATGAPTWIHAGAQRAEAGFHDPALGWVGVRADLGGGGIHASLVPDSADSAQALGGHMAGLNAYLAEQHTPVEVLTVAAPENHSAASGLDQTGSQQMHQGAGQDGGQGEPSRQLSDSQRSSPAVTAAASLEDAVPAGRPDSSDQMARTGGNHISVMA